jgi:nucleoside-diphosphate-sugar epimerase
VVDGNLRALTAAGQVLNLAAGGQVSLNVLARTLGDILRVPVNPTYAALRAGDIRDSLADISRAQAVLGYTPRVDLHAGLVATISWLQQQTPARPD